MSKGGSRKPSPGAVDVPVKDSCQRRQDPVPPVRDGRMVQVCGAKDYRGDQQAPQLAPRVRDALNHKVLQDAPEEELLTYCNRHVNARKGGQELEREP